MDADDRPSPLLELTRTAERFDDLADTAELMGDDHAAGCFRADAATCRRKAMDLLDP